MEQKLKGFRASGALDAETFGEYQAKIDQARTALGSADTALSRTGMTAKATAAALRGVPAQFTDIFTSIAAGQPIMMVALQQGGQLKDMFGGIIPAAKALGGYILGLVNPLTVSAVAAAALGYMFTPLPSGEVIPRLHDACVNGMAQLGMNITGVEEVDGVLYAQSWWCRAAGNYDD
ncbi:phage tail length tape measure family protein [Pseudomonas sp. p1(2021b)]|nr:phage tail length tape measure family protein [Pseudomonas sp. p1(2021b)]